MVTEAKVHANRLNALKSTGPTTEAGKARSRLNAVRHGLYAAAVVLPGEDPAEFAWLRREYIVALKPQDALELTLVDRIVGAAWRLRRVADAERLAHVGIAECNSDEDRDDGGLRPGYETQVLGLRGKPGGLLERLGAAERRLEGTMHKCLRELRLVRQAAARTAELPESPFLEPEVEPEADTEEAVRDQVRVEQQREAAFAQSIERYAGATRVQVLPPTFETNTKIVRNEPIGPSRRNGKSPSP
jgi:hypothetical protein